jgi:exopolyphosphatase/guanosine-5'-triphosphate,3'-diphosphate pyrophosphatase
VAGVLLPKEMIISVIDIGTNTMLMLVGEYNKTTSQILTIYDAQKIPRLGKGVDADRNISNEAISKAIEILNEYKKTSNRFGSKKIIASATSFLRDANNKEKFIDEIEKETGITIEILSGDDEARWAFWGGAYEQIQTSNYKSQICTIDIGGGSTEIVTGKDIPAKLERNILLSHPIEGKSVDIGSVRIKERFLNDDIITKSSIKDAEEFIRNELSGISIDSQNTKLIGIAGTITTLAAIKKGLKKFDKTVVDNTSLTTKDVENLLKDFLSKSSEQISSLGEYMEGRADIIMPGTLILKTFMEKFGLKNVKVSTKGLRYGIFLREALL